MNIGVLVRVLLEGRDVTGSIPACEHSLLRLPRRSGDPIALCPLNELATFLTEQLLDISFGAKSWAEACAALE